MYATNDPSAWHLPDDWTTTTVEIKQTVTRQVVVAHPRGATTAAVADDAHQRFVQSHDVDEEFGMGEVDDLFVELDGELFEHVEGWEPTWSARAAELRGVVTS